MIILWVPGIPAPGGSKKQMLSHTTGKIITMDACDRNADWRSQVAQAAYLEMVGKKPMMGPLSVRFEFTLPRPKSHYLTGKNKHILKKYTPSYHIVKPDLTKLIRAAEDACTGIIWRDDCQIARQEGVKYYQHSFPRTENAGLVMRVCELE